MPIIMRKVLILILLPLLLMAVITSSVSIYSLKKYLIETTYEDLLNQAVNESAGIEKMLSVIEASISVLSFSLGAQFQKNSFDESGDEYLTEFRNDIAPIILKTAQSINNCKGVYFMFSPEYGTVPTQVWYNDKYINGQFERIFEYPDPDDFQENDPNLAYYYTPLKNHEPYWSEPYIDVDTDVPLISFTLPVWNNSEIFGIAGLDISIEYFKEILNDFRYLDTGYALLLDSRSKVIFHPLFPFNTSLEDILDEELDFLLEELQSENIQNTEDYIFQGEKKRLGYKRLNNNWLLGITTFEKEMLEPVKQIQNILAGISGVLFLLCVAISYIAAQFISKPVIQLTKEIRQNAYDFTSVIDNPFLISRKDEIGNLTREFKALQIANRNTVNRIISNNIELERHAQLGRQVGGFTHEIKTPIGVVLTSLTFLEDILKDFRNKMENNKLKISEMNDFVSNIEKGITLSIRNIEQAGSIISSFKNVSVSQSDIRYEKVNLKKLIDDIDTSLSIGSKKKKYSIEKNINIGLELQSIPGYLTQVFTNLIQNSIRHGFQDRIDGKITISCLEEKEEIQISYSDDGTGISDENADKIFEPYFTSAKDRGGTGLGLHLIQTIIHNYLNGTIEYKKNKKPGVLFHITLPRKKI